MLTIAPLHSSATIFRATACATRKRPGWTTDGIYFLISHVAVELLTFFTLLPATFIARSFHADISGLDPSVLPLAVEVLAVMLVADLSQYAVHRTFHSVGWLWPFHAIHHSSRTLDWLAGSRLHLVDIIVTRALILVPLFALGFSQMALYTWLVIVAVHRRDAAVGNVVDHVLHLFRCGLAHQNMQAERWWATCGRRLGSQVREERQGKIAPVAFGRDGKSRPLKGFLVPVWPRHGT